MMYQAVETAMIGLAQVRNLSHTDHDDLLRLARSLDEEHGTAGSHFVRFESARAMHDNAQLHFLDVEETLMSPENARAFIRSLEGVPSGRMTPAERHPGWGAPSQGGTDRCRRDTLESGNHIIKAIVGHHGLVMNNGSPMSRRPAMEHLQKVDPRDPRRDYGQSYGRGQRQMGSVERTAAGR